MRSRPCVVTSALLIVASMFLAACVSGKDEAIPNAGPAVGVAAKAPAYDYEVNPTGPTLSSPVTLSPIATFLVGMAFDPSAGDQLYVIQSGYFHCRRIVRGRSNYRHGNVGGKHLQADLQGLAFDNAGALYAVSAYDDICKVDKTTGEASLLGGPPKDDFDSQALEFDEAGRMFRARVNFVEVDQSSWDGIVIGPTGYSDIRGLAAAPAMGDDIDAITISSVDLAPGKKPGK